MHIVAAGLYSVISWLGLLAYLAITSNPWLIFAALSAPLIISGTSLVLIGLDALVRWLMP